MPLYNKETKLSEALLNHPSLIPLVERLGMKLGSGDLSIEELCKKKKINESFFLSMLNTFIDPNYFPSDTLSNFPLEETIDYLEKTDDSYWKIQFPNIERHFKILLQVSGSHNNLSYLFNFFLEIKGEFFALKEKEDGKLFEEIRNKIVSRDAKKILVEDSLALEEKFQDLLILFVAHLKGDYDMNLCTAVVNSIFFLRQDIRQNNRIRRRILLPLIELLEKS